MTARDTGLILELHKTLTGVLIEPTTVSGGGPVSTPRNISAVVEADSNSVIDIVRVTPTPSEQAGFEVEEVVLQRGNPSGDPVEMAIWRNTPSGLARYLLHRVKAVFSGIADSFKDAFEDRF